MLQSAVNHTTLIVFHIKALAAATDVRIEMLHQCLMTQETTNNHNTNTRNHSNNSDGGFSDLPETNAKWTKPKKMRALVIGTNHQSGNRNETLFIVDVNTQSSPTTWRNPTCGSASDWKENLYYFHSRDLAAAQYEACSYLYPSLLRDCLYRAYFLAPL